MSWLFEAWRAHWSGAVLSWLFEAWRAHWSGADFAVKKTGLPPYAAYEALQTALNERPNITAELHTVVVGSRGGFSHGNLATLTHLGKFVSDDDDALLVPRAAEAAGRALHLIAARASGALVACRTAADQELFNPSKKTQQGDGAAPAVGTSRHRSTRLPATQQQQPPPKQQQQPPPPSGRGTTSSSSPTPPPAKAARPNPAPGSSPPDWPARHSTAAAAAEAILTRFAAGRGGASRARKKKQPQQPPPPTTSASTRPAPPPPRPPPNTKKRSRGAAAPPHHYDDTWPPKRPRLTGVG